ncbi:MAG: MBL fold metallo-hydrolase [Clostridium sp.]|jgi:glyoxylase-like metal-dependent hydrolase (beta-lactamase superfamily II)|uniref:MBL fold metallo-hydrolase n=1 Tax=Clostridium sp. TaxID=1506 RepID=UPI0025BC4ECB|nr:MBL fold metallo-hydrolase [Clostridium sp.]MCH3962895.1 MBL fold metallo-hydrolase [Clostridium sp.]MCI1715690.1 MBL fold metallo-hydrolase [Clostridium sp.]MCI1800105.1 MBL fold metallo-hydrolase [Clostridium sp.]MCI1814019.1 MBL fold metallo-hydrolase [Clostridium sp.]MCI1870917.1 MBL fold metallo-hydrolase [Clostridium sp.]
MKIQRMSVGMYAANCYIVLDENSNECAVIDPGGDSEVIKNALKAMNAGKVKFILLTHGHADHTGAALDIKNSFNAPIYCNKEDYNMMKRGTFMYGNVHDSVDEFLKDGDKLTFGGLEIKVIYTPGHSPGGVCFLVDNVVFTGDTLFSGSIGRTDMEGGDFDTLIDSIKNRLMILPDNTVVLPGHEGESSIGRERNSNPFL